MANQHGDFIWYELLTSDTDAAADFYKAVIGWSTSAPAEAYGGYRQISAADGHVGGMMVMPPQASGSRPHWYGYVGVDDVDATAQDIVAAGGTQHVPPTDIKDVGRFAVFADPQGAMFNIMRGVVEGTSTAFAHGKIGHCAWNELTTSDPEAAIGFYGERFGWTNSGAMPMGEMGDYLFLSQGEQMIGAVMKGPAGGPPPAWLFYFAIEDINRAGAAVTANGGTVHHGPSEIPGGDFIVIAADPQGAMFGLVGPRTAAAS